MYKYEICNIYDRKIFYKQDKALVKNIRGLKELSWYDPVMHIHDEMVTEVPEGFGSIEE